MLRFQREWGKSRGGVSVPLCIKLQGAVLCGKPQHHNNGTGLTCQTDSFERSDAEDKQPCSSLASPVYKTEASHSENREQPHGKEQSSGKLFSLMLRLNWYLWLGHRGIKNTLSGILRRLVHNPSCCIPAQIFCSIRLQTLYEKYAEDRLKKQLHPGGKVIKICCN